MKTPDFIHLEDTEKAQVIKNFVHPSLAPDVDIIARRLNSFALSDLKGLKKAITEIIRRTKVSLSRP